ncbi:MAG: hypothetical protein Athens101428_464 [Candidatus Berkelbacteria bacterium Athens1014_28]|uniref:GTP-binding signal recognition particle n=1 Tax=Candidatus Berkelbacteria bacterium Athens1014_28 TaxID=2017145 RepID=A0A554LM70_9BACT|nr:MAG: hypothetical protein Athens101428_464 [Candidatus Berkelbacteria bacterium Athens1014_28]
MEKYPESKLTEKIIGLVFKTQNETGKGFSEKIYQKVFENHLRDEEIKFKKECYCKLIVNNKIAGNYRLDFLIDDKIIVEFKVRDAIYKKDISQVLNYLKFYKLKIGLIFYFKNDGVEIKRLIL